MIDMDYRDTRLKAASLSEQGDKMVSIAQISMSSVCFIRSHSWNGSPAELYERKLEALQRNIRSHGESLQKIGSNLKKAADRYEFIEETAKSIFGTG